MGAIAALIGLPPSLAVPRQSQQKSSCHHPQPSPLSSLLLLSSSLRGSLFPSPLESSRRRLLLPRHQGHSRASYPYPLVPMWYESLQPLPSLHLCSPSEHPFLVPVHYPLPIPVSGFHLIVLPFLSFLVNYTFVYFALIYKLISK